MIASLTGVVQRIAAGAAVIDVHGVGYLVHCSGRTLAALLVGAPASLAVETHVREDAIQLFGFSSEAERECFTAMTAVQGVGAKAALAVLTVLTPDALVRAVATTDTRAITRAAGVGPRLAGRIVGELRDRLTLPAEGPAGAPLPELAPGEGAVAPEEGDARDAIMALVGLGFRHSDAASAVAGASHELGEGAGLDDLIRAGLSRLAPPPRADL